MTATTKKSERMNYKMEDLKMKYIVNYGNGNTIETNSRNARKWVNDLGENIVITTKTGKFVCEGTRQYDGTITVSTIEC